MRAQSVDYSTEGFIVQFSDPVDVFLEYLCNIVFRSSANIFLAFAVMAEQYLVDKNATFTSFSNILDARILRALADMGFARPTLVQAEAIPLALESRDILARARTGSGKTAAYCVPIIQKILSAKSVRILFRSGSFAQIGAAFRHSMRHMVIIK